MQSGCYSNTNADRMFYQYGMDKNNKIIDSYIIVSQVYDDIRHNSFKSYHKKLLLSTLLAYLVR
jgi:hypothetical protein